MSVSKDDLRRIDWNLDADAGFMSANSWLELAREVRGFLDTEITEHGHTQFALSVADDLLRRLSEWDMLHLNGDGSAATADAPFWQGEIARVRAEIEALPLSATEAQLREEIAQLRTERDGYRERLDYSVVRHQREEVRAIVAEQALAELRVEFEKLKGASSE